MEEKVQVTYICEGPGSLTPLGLLWKEFGGFSTPSRCPASLHVKIILTDLEDRLGGNGMVMHWWRKTTFFSKFGDGKARGE